MKKKVTIMKLLGSNQFCNAKQSNKMPPIVVKLVTHVRKQNKFNVHCFYTMFQPDIVPQGVVDKVW